MFAAAAVAAGVAIAILVRITEFHPILPWLDDDSGALNCDDNEECTNDITILGSCLHLEANYGNACNDECLATGGTCYKGKCSGSCLGECTVSGDCPKLVAQNTLAVNVTGVCSPYFMCTYAIVATMPYTSNVTDIDQPLYQDACFSQLGSVTYKDCLEVTIPSFSSGFMNCVFDFLCASGLPVAV